MRSHLDTKLGKKLGDSEGAHALLGVCFLSSEAVCSAWYFWADNMHPRMVKSTSEVLGSVCCTAKWGWVWVGDRSEV